MLSLNKNGSLSSKVRSRKVKIRNAKRKRAASLSDQGSALAVLPENQRGVQNRSRFMWWTNLVPSTDCHQCDKLKT